ncbi:hypothetical protein N7517_006764 [Penicillium concentricum]|uniref:Uncharacterized protein n=1 Tax=Penicillium concentricum TaxID=293559 RepID=A0A9W9SEN5_9EURO|nr:uncharacterized protein N7517_006764 [Penicillium concentricum]KAJ5374758.1 hypothetical protein N7517_006764 [Penicillium concentricum]
MEHGISALCQYLAEIEQPEVEAKRQLSLYNQTKAHSSTKGNHANADNKLCPAKIRKWKGAPLEQTAIWADLMRNDL